MSRAWIASSTPSSRDLIWNGKPAPSTYLHKQLDVTSCSPSCCFSLTSPTKRCKMFGAGVSMFENVRADVAMAREQNVGLDQWDRRLRVSLQPVSLAVLSYRFCHWMRSIRVPLLRHFAWLPVVIVGGFSQVLTGVH